MSISMVDVKRMVRTNGFYQKFFKQPFILVYFWWLLLLGLLLGNLFLEIQGLKKGNMAGMSNQTVKK